MEYTLTRSRRKTVAIYVRDGAVEVRAPSRTPKRDIDRFVTSKEKWITDKLAQSGEQLRLRKNFALTYGECVTYRGKQYPIVARYGKQVGFDGEEFYLPSNLTSEQIKAACVRIYRMLARRDLTEKVTAFAEQMSAMPAGVKINGAKTRWGSCSSRKSLNFSWRLIMAKDDVIDYVVVHELAHLTEMNHSPRFWAIVAGVLSDYRERQARLKELQRRLEGEDWD
ncbi:MAG: M48 family metallopeptidase [Oscillospiraceae bacterium]|nr:M48 family metallopeptidase [Oscillospiraceae bacterium]